VRGSEATASGAHLHSWDKGSGPAGDGQAAVHKYFFVVDSTQEKKIDQPRSGHTLVKGTVRNVVPPGKKGIASQLTIEKA